MNRRRNWHSGSIPSGPCAGLPIHFAMHCRANREERVESAQMQKLFRFWDCFRASFLSE